MYIKFSKLLFVDINTKYVDLFILYISNTNIMTEYYDRENYIAFQLKD